MMMQKILVAAAATTLFLVAINSIAHDANAHSTIGSGATVKNVDRYQIAFQLYPKYASAGQGATLHFSVLDKNSSSVNSVYAAMVMKEKGSGEIVEQVPYRFYEAGDISIPYRFHDNEDYVATLLTRVDGDPKHEAAPLQVDFDVPVGQATVMSPTDLALMVVPFAAALAGGIMFVLRKKT